LRVSASKITRWLKGHHIGAREYAPLWKPQVDIGDGRTYLGFRDLMEVRIADTFIRYGLSAQRVRSAIGLARQMIGEDRPLSTNQFRTDGRDIFFRVLERDESGEERERLLNLFRRQYEFRQIIEPLLKTVDFDDRGAPVTWWPDGRRNNIVVDPARAFGQPIDAVTSVPTAILAAAAKVEGVARAAKAFEVPATSVRRAMRFEAAMERRIAA
jgi:hypothetical protein